MSYRLNSATRKIEAALIEIYKMILKSIQNLKEPRVTKIILNKNNIFERTILLLVKYIIKLVVWQFDICVKIEKK